MAWTDQIINITVNWTYKVKTFWFVCWYLYQEVKQIHSQHYKLRQMLTQTTFKLPFGLDNIITCTPLLNYS